MLSQNKLATAMLVMLAGLAGLSACRRDEPEPAPQGEPQAQEAPTARQEQPAQQATRAQDAPSPKRASPASQPSKPTTATSDNASDQPLMWVSSARIITAEDQAGEAAQKELAARWDEHQSVSAKVTTTFERHEGLTTYQKGKGERDCMRKDGKLLVRSKVFNSINAQREHGQWIATAQRVTQVFDGELLYTLDERHEGKTFTKSRPTPGRLQYIGGRRLFDRMRLLDGVRLLPDETIDGKSVYVFEGSAGEGRIRTHHYIDKETGILLKLVVKREDPKSRYTFALSDIELNVEFSEDHFTLAPPEDAEIQDLTKAPLPRAPASVTP